MRRIPLHVAIVACLLAVLPALTGCGEDAEPVAPEAPVPPPGRAAAEALGGLVEIVRGGAGVAEAGWTGIVQDTAHALWPDLESAEHGTLRRRHTNLSLIAGDTALQLAQGGEGARADWMERDPTSVEILDAFVAAAEGGADAYRAWLATAGGDLLERRARALTGVPPR